MGSIQTSFRARIFRLLLLFAAVPAVLLTGFAYYLSVEAPMQPDSESHGDLSKVTDFYHGYLFRDLNGAVDRYLATGEAPTTLVDFLVVNENDRTLTVIGDSLLTPDVIERMGVASEEKDHGIMASGDNYLQYVKRELDPDRMLFAGFVFDSSFTSALNQVQKDYTSRSVRRELYSTYVTFVGGLFLVLVCLMFGAAWFLSRRVSRNLAGPLSALSSASKGIAEGDFQQEVAVDGDAEIRSLIENFNRMAAALDETTTRLAQTERVAAWRQVARRFAHELKNPLQPILVSLYRIEKQLADTDSWEQIREPLQAASEEVRHLTQLAERFSHLAKLPPPKLESVSLRDLIQSVAELYEDKLKNHQFDLQLPNEDAVAVTDKAYLREVLHNLLQNSIDATPPGHRISLLLSADEDQVSVAVSDEGSGMDEETLSSARLPYFTTKKKGTGLGLAIVDKSIAELGGQMIVESEKGRGTTITINLPGRPK